MYVKVCLSVRQTNSCGMERIRDGRNGTKLITITSSHFKNINGSFLPTEIDIIK